MKWWTKPLIPALVFAMVGGADAKRKGGKGGGSELKGEIANVQGTDVIVAGHGKSGDQTVTIHTTARTTVTLDGVAGKSIADLAVGDKVEITPPAGTALSIVAKTKHHKKKKQ